MHIMWGQLWAGDLLLDIGQKTYYSSWIECFKHWPKEYVNFYDGIV